MKYFDKVIYEYEVIIKPNDIEHSKQEIFTILNKFKIDISSLELIGTIVTYRYSIENITNVLSLDKCLYFKDDIDINKINTLKCNYIDYEIECELKDYDSLDYNDLIKLLYEYNIEYIENEISKVQRLYKFIS